MKGYIASKQVRKREAIRASALLGGLDQDQSSEEEESDFDSEGESSGESESSGEGESSDEGESSESDEGDDRRMLSEIIDWTSLMTPVDDQGNCGSCWTFSGLHPMEGMIAKRDGTTPVKLSRQQLLDCSHRRNRAFTRVEFGFSNNETNNAGCNGGYMDTTFRYLQENGVPLDEDFPYVPRQGTRCRSTTDPEDCSCQHDEANNEKIASF